MMRCFGNWLLVNSTITDISFRLVKKPTNKTDIVTLTVDQISYLYELDLSASKKLERVRDLYCLNSNLGLRFSDLHSLTPANFKDGFMVVRTRKTDNTVRVPLNSMARSILEKYDYKLPKISNVKFNKFIKDVGEVAKFDALHEVHTFKRGIKERHLVPLKNLLTSHQCRRNFATNCLRLGLPPSLTQKLTGHASYAVFAKYISVADEYLANEFNKVWESAYQRIEENGSKPG
jgi:integrase